MALHSNSSIAELRNDLEQKRNKALELQMNTEDSDEWSGLNTLRWELEDLDKDLYLGQFIRNNDALSKLTGEIAEGTGEAAKLISTIQEVERAIQDIRETLKQASPIGSEISVLIKEVEDTITLIRDGE